jgi:hypothetical protein
MPLAEDVLGFTNQWYGHAFTTARTIQLEPGLAILMVTAPAFLATKWAARTGRRAQRRAATREELAGISHSAVSGPSRFSGRDRGSAAGRPSGSPHSSDCPPALRKHRGIAELTARIPISPGPCTGGLRRPPCTGGLRPPPGIPIRPVILGGLRPTEPGTPTHRRGKAKALPLLRQPPVARPRRPTRPERVCRPRLLESPGNTSPGGGIDETNDI